MNVLLRLRVCWFGKGRDWIENPTLTRCGLMFRNVSIILVEEIVVRYATPACGIVLLANAPRFLTPMDTA
jgi:hypothetical protein